MCLDRYPAVELRVTSRWSDILLQDVLVDIHGSVYHGQSSRSRGSKTAPDQTPRAMKVLIFFPLNNKRLHFVFTCVNFV